MSARIALFLTICTLTLNVLRCQAADAASRLIVQTKQWQGEYWTSDKPGGVRAVPTTSAAYVIPLDGTPPKPFSAGKIEIEYPNYSPDARWVYFQSHSSGQSEIYRCREDGSELACLTARHDLPGESYGFSFSPDGSKLVYAVHDGKIARVALMNADGTGARLLAPDLGHCYMASFSTDGQGVVLSHTENGYRLVFVSLDGSKKVLLAPTLPESFGPRMLPDGRTILFFRRDGDIYSVQRDGSQLRRLTEGNHYLEFKLSDKDEHGSSDGPDPSPDGSQIAYIRKVDGVPQVHVMRADGSQPRQLTRRLAACGRVRWSPDGRSISFVSFAPAYPQLFIMPAAGGDPRQVTSFGDRAVVQVQWRPPGGGKGK